MTLFSRLQRAARDDPKTVWSDVVTEEGIAFAEDVFGFALPGLLRRSYLEISNGGFGPGPLIGLPGGYESSWGDLFKTWEVMRDDEDWEEGWLPIIDWGCTDLSIIDCDDDFRMVSRYEGDFHPESYSFNTLLERWIDGELPRRDRGGFYRP
jgi:hypothetical protein